MKKYEIFLLLGFLLGTPVAFAQSKDDESTYSYPADSRVRAKLEHWQDLKFGLFMHWGTYSQWGVTESWTISPEDYAFCKRTGPYAANYAEYKKAYENLQTTFNPTRFNPEKWARAAREAGMKYVVFTTKHHDGFCMFHTQYTDYNITDPKTPFSGNPRSDVTKAIFKAFREDGFMVGAYFSKPDWHSNDFWWRYFPPKDRNVNYDIKKYPERWQRFVRFTYNQIKELMTGYGTVDLLWLDGDWAKINIGPVVRMARQYQRGLIVVDRHGSPEYVNYLTPEQHVPDHYMAVPWETCMTMGKSWSYNLHEQYRPSRKLIQILVDVVAKNGNLLLDIGPGPDGEWHQEAYQRLHEIGAWIRVNGESIYGTRPIAPYRKGKWAFTGKGEAWYATYLPEAQESRLPSTLEIPIAVGDKKHIRLLGCTQKLSVEKTSKALKVAIPRVAIQSMAGRDAWVFKID